MAEPTIRVEDDSKPNPGASYRIVKTGNSVLSWRILNDFTGENLTGRRYASEEDARAVIAEMEQYKPRPNNHQLGTVDLSDEERLLANETPAMRAYWEGKGKPVVTAQDARERYAVAKPEPSEAATPPSVSRQEIEELESKLKTLKAQQSAEEPPDSEDVDVADIIEDRVEAERELAKVVERVGRVEQLTRNVSKLAEICS